jgi:hypothetical protein
MIADLFLVGVCDEPGLIRDAGCPSTPCAAAFVRCSLSKRPVDHERLGILGGAGARLSNDVVSALPLVADDINYRTFVSLKYDDERDPPRSGMQGCSVRCQLPSAIRAERNCGYRKLRLGAEEPSLSRLRLVFSRLCAVSFYPVSSGA